MLKLNMLSTFLSSYYLTQKKKLSQWSHAIYNYLTTVVYNRESLACEASEQLNELYQNIVVMTVNKCK